ncbi:MAG: hypothetical protein IKT68_03730, partial [Clostridia bacterium]|nr:hypothetical protein [Clostridia bacterium]
ITFGAAVSTQGWHLITLDSNQTVTGNGTIHNGVTKVADLDSTTAIMSYTIGSGVSYIRMVVDTNYKDKYLYTKNQPFTVAQYQEFFGNTSGGTTDPTPSDRTNLFDLAKATTGWVNSTGNSPDGAFKTSDYIGVSAGDVITFGAAVSTQGWHLVVYNSSKSPIADGKLSTGVTQIATLDDTTSIMKYTIPSGGAYVRMVADARYLNKYLVTKNDPFTAEEYDQFFHLQNPNDGGNDAPVITDNPLKDKTALFIGDSICYGQWDTQPRQGWAGRIKTQFGMASVTNAGVGGTTISTEREGRIVTQLHNNKNNSYDYVIMQGGTNDGWGDLATTTAAPVGKMTNSFALKDFDTSTFAGGLEELFYYATQYFPNAKLGFMTTFATPLGASQNLGATGDMDAYYTLAVQICEKWGIQCLDLFHDRYVSNTLMKVNTYECLQDPLHPNATGYDNLAPYIGEWMSRMVSRSTYQAKPFTNKRALFVGDSISYGHGDTPQGRAWAGRLADSLGILSDNQSCSGWSVSTIRAAQIVQQLERNKEKQFDYVIMHGGINDSWDNAPKGVMTNSYNPEDFDRTTFGGALEHLFYYAYQYFPNARLGYIINFKMPAASSDMGVYRELALQICKKWKVSCYDMHADDAVTNALQAHTLTNMADAGHPNKAGYDIISPYIANWFTTIPYASIASFESQMPSLESQAVKMPYVKNRVLYVNECDKVYGWSGAYSTNISVDKEDKVQGQASVVLTALNPTGNKISDTHYIGSMAFLKFPQAADLSCYDTLSFDYYLSENMAGKTGQLQLNFATTGDDGYNTLITLDGKKAGWHTATFGTNLAGFKAVDFDWKKINKLRYTWWNLNQSVANMTVKIDNIRFYNAAEQAQKNTDVTAVIQAINKIGQLTLDNFKSKESTLVYAEELSDALMAKYGNTILEEVTNAADLVKAREEFTRLTFQSRDLMVDDLIADIDAIGKITNQNYLQKEKEIAAIEQSITDLVAQYGKEAKALVTNVDKLTAAKQSVEALKQANVVPYGDVDGDGKVSAADALEVLKNVVGNATFTADQKELADVDGNGRVTSADALYILKKVVGKIDKFPVEQ